MTVALPANEGCQPNPHLGSNLPLRQAKLGPPFVEVFADGLGVGRQGSPDDAGNPAPSGSFNRDFAFTNTQQLAMVSGLVWGQAAGRRGYESDGAAVGILSRSPRRLLELRRGALSLSDPHYAFIPAWVNPHHPAVAQALTELFTRAGSPWLPLMQPHLGRMAMMGMMFGTPMIDVPSFRRAIINGLSDLTPAGSVTVTGTVTTDGGGVEMAVDGYSPNQMMSDPPAPDVPKGLDLPPLGSKVSIRLADIYAYELHRWYHFKQCPDFALYWPEVKRDAALAAIKAFLQQPGNLGHTGSWRL